MVTLRGQNKMFCLSFAPPPPLDQIPKIKIFHMVVSEHTEVVEMRRGLIATDNIDSEEVAGDGSIDNNGDALDEDDGVGLGEAGVIACVT